MDTVAYACLSLTILILGGLLFFFLWGKNTIVVENRDNHSPIKWNAFPFLYSTIALMTSVIAIALVCPKANVHLAMDYYDVIIAILAILITILLGWQIYNGIKFEEYASEAKQAAENANQAKESIEKKIKEVDDYKATVDKKFEDIYNRFKSQIDELKDSAVSWADWEEITGDDVEEEDKNTPSLGSSDDTDTPALPPPASE